MRHAMRLAAVAVLLGAAWVTVTLVLAAGDEKASGSAAPAGTIALAAAKSPPAAPIRPAAAPTPTGTAITPPAPLPDFEIPPIPEVSRESGKAGQTPVRTLPPGVFEEGKRLFNREGMLQMDPLGRSMFAFNSGDKPMYILENSWREYLENITEQGTKKVRWRVSGLITVYGGQNYLLLTKIVHVLPEEENR
jgi:hypothetical protein